MNSFKSKKFYKKLIIFIFTIFFIIFLRINNLGSILSYNYYGEITNNPTFIAALWILTLMLHFLTRERSKKYISSIISGKIKRTASIFKLIKKIYLLKNKWLIIKIIRRYIIPRVKTDVKIIVFGFRNFLWNYLEGVLKNLKIFI